MRKTVQRFAGISATAATYGLSRAAVLRWIRQGTVRAVRLGQDGSWRVDLQDLERALVENVAAK